MTSTIDPRSIPLTILHRRGDETYVLLFDHAHRREAFAALVLWAIDPLLSFAPSDAAAMARRIGPVQV